jgi:hypothetical protein
LEKKKEEDMSVVVITSMRFTLQIKLLFLGEARLDVKLVVSGRLQTWQTLRRTKIEALGRFGFTFVDT